MNHRELIGAVATRLGAPEDYVSRLLEVAVDTMSAQLCEGNQVGVQGFGTLEVRRKEERISVNPATQVRTLVPPKLVVNFKQSNVLKDKLKGLPHE